MARGERVTKAKGAGGRQISALLDAEEAALLARHVDREGGVKAAVIAGLRALDRRNDLSNKELIAIIERRLK
jgi:hypothetical protein